MRLAALLHCADADRERFNKFRLRDQLPFKAGGGGWTNYTLDDAFRLRLMLDLLGGESEDETQLRGLGPGYAASLISNALTQFPHHPLNFPGGSDWFCGVLVLENVKAGGERLRRSAFIACDLPSLHAVIERKRREASGIPAGLVRLFLANATRAADFVRDRAAELELPEADDHSEIGR